LAPALLDPHIMINLLKAATFPIVVFTESKRVHQPPKMPKNVVFGG
jgi:hypothetical protein